MRKTLWMAACAMIFAGVALASPKISVLDGTSWKIDVEPDGMAKDKGEKQFKETLTFADGNITLSVPKVGTEASPYSVTKEGEKDYTFKAERSSSGEGDSVWTGTIHGKEVSGKMILTKTDGGVFTFTFKGDKLD